MFKKINVQCHGIWRIRKISIIIAAKRRILSFWARLITSQETKINCMLYKLLYKIHVSNFQHKEWLM